MVKPIDDFSVAQVTGDLPQSDLLWRGGPVGVRVDGVTLEKQWQVGTEYLLLLTEDSPYEEGLHIYLLDEEKRVKDALEIAGPYAPGTLRDVAVDDDAAVSFSFFGEDRWRVEVNASAKGFLTSRVSSPAKRKSGLRGSGVLTAHRVR